MSSAQAENVSVRVLVVEDHVALANRIGEGLRDAGFAVDVAYDASTALESTASTQYDVVVLDRDLPNVHGDEGEPSRTSCRQTMYDVEEIRREEGNK
jgi:DNA-binding response OmpR family regulator